MSTTQNYVAKYTASPPTTADSQIVDNGTNVGVGTASPGEKLHIYKSTSNYTYSDVVRIEASGGGPGSGAGILFQGNVGQAKLARIKAIDADNWDGKIVFDVSNATGTGQDTMVSALTILGPLGNVGVGTTVPGVKFEVNGAGKFSGQLDMNSNKVVNVTDPTANQDAATKKYVDDTVAAGTGSAWTHNADGVHTHDFVGINIDDPNDQRFVIYDTNGLSDVLCVRPSPSSGNRLGGLRFNYLAQAGQSAMIDSYFSGTVGTDTGGDLRFYTTNLGDAGTCRERMRIALTGKVGIGVSGDATEMLEVNGPILIKNATCELKLQATSGDNFKIRNTAGAFSIYNETDLTYGLIIDGANAMKVGGSGTINSGLHIAAGAGGADKGYLTMEEIGTAPSAPGTGKVAIYMRSGALRAKIGTDNTEKTFTLS